MRVIAGISRGVPLKVVRAAGLRPTSDLVRGAIFDMVGPYFSAEMRALDLYAGTGALGIEALSRGAGWADFVEQQPRCCAGLEENLARTGLKERGKVHCMPVRQALPLLNGPYRLVLADPPYADAVASQVLSGLAEHALVDPDSIIVLEHAYRVPVLETHQGLQLVKQRRHGDTMISVFVMEGVRVG